MLRTFLTRLFRRKAEMLAPGQSAPDFVLQDHQGNTVRLADLRDQRVVLWFYPKADTPG